MKTLIKLFFIIALLVVFPCKTSAKTLTIAVIDTGIDYRLPNLCKFGHKSFVPESKDPLKDDHGHGSHIAGLISKYAGYGDYCLVAIKYYSDNASSQQNIDRLEKALKYAMNINVDFVNLSGGGPEYSFPEKRVIEAMLNRGSKLVVAAGNEANDLGAIPAKNNGSDKCNYFPACYDDRIIVVGNKTAHGDRSPSSNYGEYVKRWEVGTNVYSTLPNGAMGYMSGTSQATAIATGKLVRQALSR